MNEVVYGDRRRVILSFLIVDNIEEFSGTEILNES